MKGISLPMNMIVIVIILVLVVVSILAFFLSSTGSSINEVDLNNKFAQGCLRYCSPSAEDNYLSAYEITKGDNEFLKACIGLGYGTEEFPVLCLDRCGCDLDTTKEDINTRLNQLVTTIETS